MPYEMPRVRTTDPDTAHEAVAALDVEDVRRGDALILDALDAAGNNGLTADELLKATGMRYNTCGSRLRPLERMGKIIATVERRVNVDTGLKAQVWKLAVYATPADHAARLDYLFKLYTSLERQLTVVQDELHTLMAQEDGPHD